MGSYIMHQIFMVYGLVKWIKNPKILSKHFTAESAKTKRLSFVRYSLLNYTDDSRVLRFFIIIRALGHFRWGALITTNVLFQANAARDGR